MLSLATLHVLLVNIFHILTFRKELLYPDEVRCVYRGLIRIFGILGRLKIIEVIKTPSLCGNSFFVGFI